MTISSILQVFHSLLCPQDMAVIRYEPVDRVPYFDEGIRDEVIDVWKKQGLSENVEISTLFETDRREEIFPDMEPRPELQKWPVTIQELKDFKKSLNPSDPERIPKNWYSRINEYKNRDHVVMLRVHRGFFPSMGDGDWSRFMEIILKLKKDPDYVHEALAIQAEFCAELTDKILDEIDVDAAIFSEPIGGNDHPLMSPSMYEEFVLNSYVPVMKVLKRKLPSPLGGAGGSIIRNVLFHFDKRLSRWGKAKYKQLKTLMQAARR
jgi:hypothetical protein